MRNIDLSIKRLLGIVMSALMGIAVSHAVVTDVFTMKDGTVLHGYIQSQIPGSDDITICVSRSVVVVSADEVISIEKRTCPFGSLPGEWKSWTADNPDMKNLPGGGKGLSLATLYLVDTAANEYCDTVAVDDESLAGSEDSGHTDAVVEEIALDSAVAVKTVDDVLILEEGEFIRYLDVKESLVSVTRDDIVSIRSELPGKDVLSGLSDELELRSGAVVSGFVVETVPGELMKIKKEDGVLKSYRMSDISAKRKIRLNGSQGYLEQSPVIEKACLSDGTEVEGLIIEQRYGDETVPGSVLFVNSRNEKMKLYNSNITRMYRRGNPFYKPVTKLKIEAGAVYANRAKLNPVTPVAEKKRIVIPSSSVSTLKLAGGDGLLHVETVADAASGRICLLPLTGKNKDGDFIVDNEDIITIAVPLFEKTVTGGIAKLTYSLAPGFYAVYMPQAAVAFVCRVM